MAGTSRADRAAAKDAVKLRRQKLFIGIGGALLLGIVGFQVVPGLLGGSSGSGAAVETTPPATPAASLAKPVVPSGKTSRTAAARGTAKDIFAPQVNAIGSAGQGESAEKLLTGPAVRTSNFVTKDLFIPQIQVAATGSSTATPVAPTKTKSGPTQDAGGGYIVVLASIAGTGSASQLAAARQVVAAKNSGLKDVVANDAVPGRPGSKPHFTVFTGPYEYQSTAQTELIRALRNGYPHAEAEQLPGSTGKGF